jgi:AbrB family looped-hinge helix DNA binding protein
MVSRVKVSSRNQIVVPAEVRKQLGIGPGDHLLITVRDGYMFIMPEPDDIVAHLRGLHKEIWADVDVEEYINQERDSWQN